MPKRVYFERDSLRYPMGCDLFERFSSLGVPINFTTTHNRVTGLPGDTPRQVYREAKATLVVGVRRSLTFQTSKPSADYALPLCTGCPGFCQYCYLQTTLGPRPYIRVYVNLDEILERTNQYIRENLPRLTVFEGSCTSDPVPVEPYTGSLGTTIEFFSRKDKGRFRFVTKDTGVSKLLNIEHRRHTETRVSLSTRYVTETFEAGVAPTEERLLAAKRLWEAGYPVGLLIAPVVIYSGWKQETRDLLEEIADTAHWAPSLEVVSHRFTKRAKRLILERHPETQLPLDEDERHFRYGQFGYGKYVYPPEAFREIETLFRQEVPRVLPRSEITYIV